MQVHEQARDELSWTLRPHHHHERRHPGLLSEGRLVQTGLLPPVLLLLSLRVGKRVSVSISGSRMELKHDGPYLSSYQDDLRSGELLKWTRRENRSCMYSRRAETLILVLQRWTCWRWMNSTPHSQHRLSVQTHLAILNNSAAAFLP